MKIHLFDTHGVADSQVTMETPWPPPQVVRRGLDLFTYESRLHTDDAGESFSYRQATVLDVATRPSTGQTATDLVEEIAARGLTEPGALSPQDVRQICGALLTRV